MRRYLNGSLLFCLLLAAALTLGSGCRRDDGPGAPGYLQAALGSKNNDEARCVVRTRAETYLIAGQYQDGNSASDVMLVELEKRGARVWTPKVYDVDGQNGPLQPFGAAQTADGGFLVAFNSGFDAVGLLSVDAQGEPRSVSVFRHPESGLLRGYAATLNAAGNGLTVAGHYQTAGGDQDVMILELAEASYNPRLYALGEGSNDYATGIAARPGGGYVLAGFSDGWSEGGDDDLFLIETDADLTATRAARFSGPENEHFPLLEAADNGKLLLGATITDEDQNQDFWYASLDPVSWAADWQRRVNDGGGNVVPQGLTTMDDGGAFTGYYVNAGEGKDGQSADLFLLRFGADGGVTWGKFFGGSSIDAGNDLVEVSQDGGLLVAGSTESFASSPDAYVIRTQPDGFADCNERDWNPSAPGANLSLEQLGAPPAPQFINLTQDLTAQVTFTEPPVVRNNNSPCSK